LRRGVADRFQGQANVAGEEVTGWAELVDAQRRRGQHPGVRAVIGEAEQAGGGGQRIAHQAGLALGASGVRPRLAAATSTWRESGMAPHPASVLGRVGLAGHGSPVRPNSRRHRLADTSVGEPPSPRAPPGIPPLGGASRRRRTLVGVRATPLEQVGRVSRPARPPAEPAGEHDRWLGLDREERAAHTGRPNATGAARSISSPATPTTHSVHADTPPVFRKLDAVTPFVDPLLPTHQFACIAHEASSIGRRG